MNQNNRVCQTGPKMTYPFRGPNFDEFFLFSPNKWEKNPKNGVKIMKMEDFSMFATPRFYLRFRLNYQILVDMNPKNGKNDL